MSIKKTYIPAKPRSSKLVGTSMSGGVAGGVSSSSAGQNAHSHSNKVVLDKLTDGDIDVLGKLSLDEDGNIKVDTTLWATGGISALGLGGGGGGGDFDRLDAWVDYNETKANWVLSALLGYDLHTRVNSLEAGGGASNIEIAITGSGNAVTGVSKSGNTLTFAKSSTFALSTHNHTIANITGLQDALDGKEPSFAKNTAFNKNFGTTAGTVAQGNDSRILNGQTAFGWGNHSSVGYALNSALTTHINKVNNPHAVTKSQVGLGNVDNAKQATKSEFDTHTGNSTIHITATERTNWNDANSKKHTHSNKALLDLITQSNIDVLAKLSIVDGNVKVDTTLWATGGISALGLGSGGGSGGGGADMLQSWETYTSEKANFYVPASLLVPFRDDTLSRLNNIEIGGRNLIIINDSFENKAMTLASAGGSEFSETGSFLTNYISVKSGDKIIRSHVYAQIAFYNKDKEPLGMSYSNIGIIPDNTNSLEYQPPVIPEDKVIEFMRVAFRDNFLGGKSKYEIKVKIEKGTIPTDWTPAPEDQESDWDITDVTSFSYIKNKPTQLSQFTDDIGVGTHIANKANPHAVTKSQVGLGSVNNTSDANKPISNAVQTALNGKLNLTGGTLSGNLMINGGATSLSLIRTTSYNVNMLFEGVGGKVYAGKGRESDFVIGGSPDLGLGSNQWMRVNSSSVTAPTFTGALSGNASSATKLQTARTIWGQSFNGEENVLGALTGATTGSFSVSVSTPKVDFGNGFTIEPSGTELVFKYNGAIKQRMLSTGTILGTGGITALATN